MKRGELMSTNKTVVLTYEGLKKYEEELEYLKSVKRLEIARKNKISQVIWRFE